MIYRASVGLDVHGRSIAAVALDHLAGEVTQGSFVGGGVECVVGAVSKMLGPSGDRVKTEGRDAAFLAKTLTVGSVVEVAVPTPAMEAARAREGGPRAIRGDARLLARRRLQELAQAAPHGDEGLREASRRGGLHGQLLHRTALRQASPR